MSLVEKIEQASGEIVSAGIALFSGAVAWLIRRVLTNQRVADAAMDQVRMLRQEIERRDKERKEQRKEDREAVKEVRDDVNAMRSEIRDMFRRQE